MSRSLPGLPWPVTAGGGAVAGIPAMPGCAHSAPVPRCCRMSGAAGAGVVGSRTGAGHLRPVLAVPRTKQGWMAGLAVGAGPAARS